MNEPHPLSDDRRAKLDEAAIVFLTLHNVEQPPVPIEEILRNPVAGMWQPDLVDLSHQSFDATERYSVRPTIARVVARYVGETHWAHERGLAGDAGFTADEVRYFARALLMPKEWIGALPASERTPASVRLRFSVPIADATERLAEIELQPLGSFASQ
jgi:hypothetical protein